MTARELIVESCEKAYNMLISENYKSLELALERFRRFVLHFAYCNSFTVTNVFTFQEVFEELIIQCNEYDVKIKKIIF